MFCKKGVIRNFAKFTGIHLCQSLFFNKGAGLRPQFCEISKNSYSYKTPLVAASECSWSLEYEKRTYQNFIIQNLRHGKEYCISKKKKLFNQSQKEVIYEYILAFAGWWSIFWNVVGSGGYISAGGGWWWIYFGWWWVVVDMFWLLVGSGGSWWVMA